MSAFDIITYISALIIPLFILFTVVYGLARKVKVYESFISGAKESLPTIFSIFPYIAAIFIAIKGFQASGALEFFRDHVFGGLLTALNVPIEIFMLAMIKPLSGSAATGVFTDIVRTAGPDSLATLMAAIIIGSAETTFYVISIYLGAVGIKKSRYLVAVCLIADFIGIIVSIVIAQAVFKYI